MLRPDTTYGNKKLPSRLRRRAGKPEVYLELQCPRCAEPRISSEDPNFSKTATFRTAYSFGWRQPLANGSLIPSRPQAR